MTSETSEVSAFETNCPSAETLELDPSAYKIRAFLAGPSGSGKTESATTLPGRKLLVDCDGRAHTIAGRKDINIFECLEPKPKLPTATRRLEKLYDLIVNECERGIFPFDGVIFDGLSAVSDYAMNWALTLDSKWGLGGAPAKQHYLPAMDWLSKYVARTLTLPCHVVWTGHIELMETEDGGAHMYLPKTFGKLRYDLPRWFNECYFCYQTADDKLGRPRFFWQTAGSGRRAFFKSALNARFAFWQDPIEINLDSPPAGFAQLLAARFGGAK